MTTKSDYPHPVVYLAIFSILVFFGWLIVGPAITWIVITWGAMWCLWWSIVWEAMRR